MRKAVGAGFASCLLLGVAGVGVAQNTNSGATRGTLTDPFGTVVRGATVTRTNNDTGVSRDYVTSNPYATILGPLLGSRVLPICGIVLLGVLSFDQGPNYLALSPKELGPYTYDWFVDVD
jgi:hypothetical protein